MEREIDKNGKEDSIIDVGQDDSHDEVQLKEVPLKWFGKRWLDLLTNLGLACLLMIDEFIFQLNAFIFS